MKKNKGFTLIELLAVIVILAIIALIAVPVVMNIINKANKSAFKDSAYGLIKAGELFYTDQLLTNAGLYEGKTVTFPNDTEGLEIKGSKPTGGYVTVNKEGQVSMTVTNGKYCVTKDFEDDDVTITNDVENCVTTNKEYKIGDVVYYNPNEAELCTETEWTNNADKNGKSGCMRWYVYGVEEDKQKLILDHNTTASIEWISADDYEDNEKCGINGERAHTCSDQGPVTLMRQLVEDTKNWKVKADIVDALDLVKLIPYFQELEDINAWQEEEIIEAYWKSYRAALQDSLANRPQNEYNSVDAYLDAVLDYAEDKYSTLMLPRGLFRDLLYEYIVANNDRTTDGYWTKTARPIYDSFAWSVHYTGEVCSYYVFMDSSYGDSIISGLRPVIKISK